ncbi:hypothetical protein STAFG_7809 [Streptomyces afghaniensis 772]|uniref:Uncharacterized protein n=1 Tax=Streptomyces afghaniensis 772 TaxID=1283301 RepID=S4MF99_9ACTN|nr:hypothetical protein STAFG_7809 [Streptomyces afghaniensis 772]
MAGVAAAFGTADQGGRATPARTSSDVLRRLVLPLYRLDAKPLALVAAGCALIGPQLLYVLRPVVGDRAFPTVGQADGIVSLLFTGGYPALTWVPFVLAGMAVARLDLAATAVRIRLALTGVALAVTGYGGSWLALRLVPGAAEALRKTAWGRACRPHRPAVTAFSATPRPGCWSPPRTARRPCPSWATPVWRSW